MSKREARRLVTKIKTGIAEIRESILALWNGQGWLALGYESWPEMCDAEFDLQRMSLPQQERRELVIDLADQGMSVRAIGSALGVGVGTVHRAIDDSDSGVPNGTPEVDHDPDFARPGRMVKGLDGKEYPSRRRATTPVPRRPTAIEDNTLMLSIRLEKIVSEITQWTHHPDAAKHAGRMMPAVNSALQRLEEFRAQIEEWEGNDHG